MLTMAGGEAENLVEDLDRVRLHVEVAHLSPVGEDEHREEKTEQPEHAVHRREVRKSRMRNDLRDEEHREGRREEVFRPLAEVDPVHADRRAGARRYEGDDAE